MLTLFHQLLQRLEHIAENFEHNLISIVLGSSFILAIIYLPFIYFFDPKFDGSLPSYLTELAEGFWELLEIWEKIILLRGFAKLGSIYSSYQSNHETKNYNETITIGWNIFIQDDNLHTNTTYTLEIPTEYTFHISELMKDNPVLLAHVNKAISSDPSKRFHDEEIPNFLVFLDLIDYPPTNGKGSGNSTLGAVSPKVAVTSSMNGKDVETTTTARDQADFIRRARNLLSKILNHSQWPEYAHRHKNYHQNIYENPIFLVSNEKEKDMATIRTTHIWLIYKEELRILLPQTPEERYTCSPQEIAALSHLEGEALENAKTDIIYNKIIKKFNLKDKTWYSRIVNLQKWAILEFDDSKAHYRRSYEVSLPFSHKEEPTITFSWIILQQRQTPEKLKRVTRRQKSLSSSSSSSSTFSLIPQFLVENCCSIYEPFRGDRSMINGIFSKVDILRRIEIPIQPSFLTYWIEVNELQERGRFHNKLKAYIQQTIKSSNWANLARSTSENSNWANVLYSIFYNPYEKEINVWMIYQDQLRLCLQLNDSDQNGDLDLRRKINFLKEWSTVEFSQHCGCTPCFTIPML